VTAGGTVLPVFRSWKALLIISLWWLAALVASLVAGRWTGAVAAGVLLAVSLSTAALRWWMNQPSHASGQSSVPSERVSPADHQVDIRSGSAEPSASITVVRRKGFGALGRRFKVALDGEVASRLRSGRSVRLLLDPGKHHLRVFMTRRWGSDTVTVDTAPGDEWTATISTDDLRTVMAKRDQGELTRQNANEASPMRLDVSRTEAGGA
jgi:hypothetical protein